ncbi:MAG: hypothetical protein FWH55_02780 [Oscillospiraceae bacterium]|nr:hypothetical protein [Oscillospiraceae bacterium]
MFKGYLERTVAACVRTFNPCEEVDEDKYAPIIGRESRYKDFDMLLSFINTQKVSATAAVGYMSKSSLLKFNKLARYDDICNCSTGDITDIRNAGDTIVSFGMTQLMRCAGVIDIVQNKFVLSSNANHYASLTMPEKAKFLFGEYMRHGNSIIDECARITAMKLRFSRSRYNLSGPRNEIVNCLKECPLNQWVDFRQLSKEQYKQNSSLFSVVGEALIRDDYYNKYYNHAGWNDFGHLAISIILS